MRCYWTQNTQILDPNERIDREGRERPSKMVKVLDCQTLRLNKATKMKLYTNYALVPDGTVDGGHVFDKIVAPDNALISHLTIIMGAPTDHQQSQSVFSFVFFS